MLVQSTLSGMDMVVYRYVKPGTDYFVQDVVYENNITEQELREWILHIHGDNPTEIEVAR